MDTQILLEEKRALLQETTKELIVDESKIFGGVDLGWEITALDGIEYRKGSSFLS